MASIKVTVTDDGVKKTVKFESVRADENIDAAIHEFIEFCDPVRSPRLERVAR